MTFADDLPDQCPPTDCQEEELQHVYRVLEGANPCLADWHSHAKKGKPCPAHVDPCRWASLSLLANRPAVEKLLKLPNFRSATHAAVLSIPAGVGVYDGQKNHYDFWRSAAANMDEYVVEVKAVRNG
jgi:hypothetical protein